MDSKFNSVERQHILQAIDEINLGNRVFHPSIGYDLIVDGKAYPPKEIFRIAYRFANDEDIGTIYGGERINRYFRNLGFEIRRKVKVWKLGCHWAASDLSFFNFIKENNIAIGVLNFPYISGDLILITEGFTVYAIAKVVGEMKAVTENEAFEEVFKKYNIPYENWVKYVQVEWYDLKKTEVFQYKLQQGIRQVRKQEIIQTVFDIWDNRTLEVSDLNFYLKSYKESPNPDWIYPSIVLTQTSWNDSGYETSFTCYCYMDMQNRIYCGQVKILMRDEKITVLPKHFTTLTNNFISLGQSSKYYDNIRNVLPFDSNRVLDALNDCTLDSSKLNAFLLDQPGFNLSLLRSSEAEKMLKTHRDSSQILDKINNHERYKFKFSFKLPRALVSHEVEFNFDKDEQLPNRFFCLVGKNGTGKTKYLSQLAKKLANDNDEGQFVPSRPIFSQVKAISFSLFDNFGTPEKQDISYELISLKDKNGYIDSRRNNKELWKSYQELIKDRDRKNLWYDVLDGSLELQNIEVQSDTFDKTTFSDFSELIDEIFSSGQKITFHFFTRLLATIDDGSIVLFDEPETHLHPNIVGRIFNMLNVILDRYNSYCIIATHSPIVLQEIPSKFIRVFERQGNMPLIFRPTIECFGENLSHISNFIFQVNEEEEIYKQSLQRLAQIKSFEEIMELFDNKLSLNAQLYLKTRIGEAR